MADSFADLWSSSTPKPKAPTLSAVSSQSSASYSSFPSQKSTKPDVFSLLASASSSSNSSSAANTPRYGTPSHASNTHPSKSAESLAASSSASKSSPYAFKDLFSSATNGGPNGNGTSTTMTLAARLEQEQRIRTPLVEKQAEKIQGLDPWAGLDSLATARGRRDEDKAAKTVQAAHDDWGLADFVGSKTSTTTNGALSSKSKPAIAIDDDDWGLGNFGAPPPAGASVSSSSRQQRQQSAASQPQPQSHSRSQQAPKALSLWDLDEFASPSASSSSAAEPAGKASTLRPSPSPHPSSRSGSALANGRPRSQQRTEESRRPHTPAAALASPDDDFDFGGREDRADAQYRKTRRIGGVLDPNDDDDADGGYGRRETGRGLLDDHEGDDESASHVHEEDDILGMLSKPVEAVRARQPPPNPHPRPHPTDASKTPITTSTRAASPPPHILGQIVEMGFSVGQAKAALAGTRDGVDVQAALESLLGSNNANDNNPPRAAAHAAVAAVPPAPPSRARGAPKGQKERERERQERMRLERGGSSARDDGNADLSVHAEKVLAHASELGLSVFSRASAFWKEGKEKVVKAYEERAAVAGNGDAGHDNVGRGERVSRRGAASGSGGTGSARVDARPKWMQDALELSDDEQHQYQHQHSTAAGGGAGFYDAPSPTAHRMSFRDGEEGEHEPAHRHEGVVVVEEVAQEVVVDLFSGHAPPASTPRQNAARQRHPVSTSASAPSAPPPKLRPTASGLSSSSFASGSGRPPASTSAPSAPSHRTRPRDLTSASPTALAQAAQHKTSGTEQFKLGQYGAAADAYGLALAALPERHLLRVPLYTNRGVARLRTGEHKGAVEDCTKALGIIAGDGGASYTGAGVSEFDPTATTSAAHDIPMTWSPSTEPPAVLAAGQAKANGGGWAHLQGLGVDLADAYVKALKRRAEAFEGQEKWSAAGRDWEALAGAGWVPGSLRSEAVRGAGRCRRMVGGATAAGGAAASGSSAGGVDAGVSAGSTPPSRTASTRPPIKSKPRPALSPSTTTTPSSALRALQSTNAQAEAEDTMRHTLKDGVDARLSAWRTGKETNIRALLASLDLVLWDEILAGGVKVNGLGALITPAQVKKGYVKAIARVHPDKLNPSNSTVEQRMLANGVFVALNEAWIAFQAGAK